MQVFEVEDPEGPLDTPSEDIGQQFGRLQLKNAAELGLPAEQLSELAAAQGDTPPPTLEQDLELWKRHVGLQQGNGEILHCKLTANYSLLNCALQGSLVRAPMHNDTRFFMRDANVQNGACCSGQEAEEGPAMAAEVRERALPG